LKTAGILLFSQKEQEPHIERKLTIKSVEHGCQLSCSQIYYQVAHNAGEYWPKNALLKKPGTINVVIGEPIKTVGKSPADLIKQVETWIETNMPKNSLRDL
jgi:1-acyl-sn-glycerol-3-phosphate acyltransferase